MYLINLNAMTNLNPHLLDGFKLPFNTSEERSDFIESLVLETITLSVTITEPSILERAITVWSKRRINVWTKLYKTLLVRYNIISNYDRTEEWVDRRDGRSIRKTIGRSENAGEYSDNSTNKGTVTDNGGNNTLTSVWGFNESAMVPSENVKVDSNNTQTTDMGTNGNGNTSSTDMVDSTDHSNDVDFSAHKGRMYGNIGITSNQEMLRQEREIALFDIFEFIINDFKNEFCLMIY